MSNSETWIVIAEHPNYMVSNMGRVKRISGLRRCGPPLGEKHLPELILTPHVSKGSGYFEVKLDKRTCLVHRLVLMAFRGPPTNGCMCAHWDGNRTNARLDNLRWATPTENNNDMDRHGTRPRGERNRMTKLTVAQVKQIREDPRKRREIAKDYGVTPEAISHVVLRKNWKWVE